MSEGQRLNSLDRFRKQSGKLVLEEHAHCEVPAGCGGVVLRWRNPRAAVPFTLHLYSPVRAACFIDGAQLRSGRLDLAPGRHVAAFVIEEVDVATFVLGDVDESIGLLLFAAVHDPKEVTNDPPQNAIERSVKVLSQDDGTWKFALQKPPTDEWTTLSFDDGDWPALVKARTPNPGTQDLGVYQCRHCTALGAACLGLPVLSDSGERTRFGRPLLGPAADNPASLVKATVWVRKVFDVPAPPASPS